MYMYVLLLTGECVMDGSEARFHLGGGQVLSTLWCTCKCGCPPRLCTQSILHCISIPSSPSCAVPGETAAHLHAQVHWRTWNRNLQEHRHCESNRHSKWKSGRLNMVDSTLHICTLPNVAVSISLP